ncbi:MAG: DUF488 domain-containing protein [Betaproteobacteria bacterium]
MSRRTLKITTIGYEGAALADFLATLKAAGVDQLLDIRELPISRRKGFSKSALSAALAAAGIAYAHERALGSPRDLRNRLREDGDLVRFFADFREYLTTQRPLLESLGHSLSGTVALLCYERNHRECHRSVVAAALARHAQSAPVHLTVHHAKQAPEAARSHPRQSLSAA